MNRVDKVLMSLSNSTRYSSASSTRLRLRALANISPISAKRSTVPSGHTHSLSSELIETAPKNTPPTRNGTIIPELIPAASMNSRSSFHPFGKSSGLLYTNAPSRCKCAATFGYVISRARSFTRPSHLSESQICLVRASFLSPTSSPITTRSTPKNSPTRARPFFITLSISSAGRFTNLPEIAETICSKRSRSSVALSTRLRSVMSRAIPSESA